MPSTLTTTHNNITIIFTEKDHSYIDNFGTKYTSVTTLIHHAFEEFDSIAVAKRKAEKDPSINYLDLVNEWAETGRKAAYFGTRLHENCENLINENFDKLHAPLNPVEEIKFHLAEEFIDKLKKDKTNMKFETEKLVFSPTLKIAGSIDLLVHKDDGSFIIYDWKNIKSLNKNSFMGKCGIMESTKNVFDSNYWHYAMQLQLYEMILKSENYIPRKSSVSRILNVFSENNTLTHHELPEVKSVMKNLIKESFEKKHHLKL